MTEVAPPELVVDPEATERARAVAEEYLPYFLSGRRAPAHLYATLVSTWHAATDTSTTVDKPPSQARLREILPDLHHTDVKVHVHARGFTIQATVVATIDGQEHHANTALFVAVEDGRITGFEEYADTVQSRPFRDALTE